MDWISVKERLPEYTCRAGSETFTHVLVSIGERPRLVTVGMYCNDIWEALNIKNVNVTHWMPLPEPPEDDSYCEPSPAISGYSEGYLKLLCLPR